MVYDYPIIFDNLLEMGCDHPGVVLFSTEFLSKLEFDTEDQVLF